jgi:hypothetical protein
MKIKELFVKQIDRPINGVIKADQRDDESIWQELDEYVTTKQVTEYLRRFFDAYLATVDNPTDPTIAARMGVWVSGFFGSGKSHFIKILSYLLSNLEATHPGNGEKRRAAQFFESKIKDPLLIGDVRRAVAGKTDVILFNIDSKADAKSDRDAILQVFLRVFNEMQGLSGDAPHVAHMERHLISKGSFDTFKEAFKASNGNEWDAERDAVDFLRDDVIAGLSAALKMSAESAGKWFDDARDSLSHQHRRLRRPGTRLPGRQGPRPPHRVPGRRGGPVHRQEHPADAEPADHHRGTRRALQGPRLGHRHQPGRHRRHAGRGQPGAHQRLLQDHGPLPHPAVAVQFQHRRGDLAAPAGEDAPKPRRRWAVWKAKGDIINNQLSFADHAVAFRRFKDADDYAAHYPFAPYQFQLLQKVFESIRKVGATGRHLARGERSMLDAFQTAAVGNGDKDIDAFVPLYDFYPSIESFLDSSVKRAIDQAGENPALEPWDIKLLRALFLIRYADAVKATVDNLATLCLDRVDADKLALKRQIQESLARLERQNLVSRNGDLWFFLTNEERDVSQEIKSVDISSAEVSRLVSELVFDEVLGGQTKVRHRDTKTDYEFNRLLDGAPWRQANQQLTLEVLSPVGGDYELMTEAKCIGRSAEGAGRAILRMANDARVDVELRTYVQIEKYISGPKTDAATPSLKRILLDRKDENRERKTRILAQLSDLLSRGDFYALGQKLTLKPQGPSVILDEALNYLVSNTYSKLGYIKVRQADPAAEIRAVLASDTHGQYKIALDGEDGNALAIGEMRQYLTVAAGTSRVLLSDVVDRFAGAPWGWRPELETVLLIARLFMAGEIKLVMEGSDLDPKSAAEPLTKAARFKQVSILKRKTADAGTRAKARDLHREIFSLQPPDDEDGLVAAFRDNLGQRKAELERAKLKAEQKHYPGAAEVAKALQAIDRQLAIRDPFEFLNAMLSSRDDWLDLAEDTHDVLSFYKTQAPVWARMLDGLGSFADNREALVKDTASAQPLADLEAIRANPRPYAQVNRIEGLLSAVEKVNEALASERREKALLSIDAKIKEATQALDDAQAEPGVRNAALRPLQELKAQLAGLVSIPRIMFLQQRAGELLDEAMDKIAAAVAAAAKAKAAVKPAPAPTPGGAPTPPPPPAPPAAKPIRVVRTADLNAKTYLETEQDVDDYVAKLRAELMAAIAAGHRARIQ